MRPVSDIGAAVIGSGFIGTVHVEALRRLGVTVHGILGSSPERAAKRASQLGVPRAYARSTSCSTTRASRSSMSHRPTSSTTLRSRRSSRPAGTWCARSPSRSRRSSRRSWSRLAEASDRIAAVNYNIRFYPLNQHLHGAVREGQLGDIRLVTGRYFQDWLFLDTDWNWRLEPDQGGRSGRSGTSAPTGSTWSASSPATVTSVMAELATVIPVRQQPAGPVATFSQERSTDTVAREMHTEDVALLLLRFADGALGSASISQVSPVERTRSSTKWMARRPPQPGIPRQPDHLWIGHRERPNEILQRARGS